MLQTPQSSCAPDVVPEDMPEDVPEEMTDGATLQPSKFCKQCFYPLDALTSQYCPECGRWFHSDRAHTYFPKPRQPIYRPQPKTAMVWSLIVLAVFIGVGIHWVMYEPPPPAPKLTGFNPFRNPPPLSHGGIRKPFTCVMVFPKLPPPYPWSAEALNRKILPLVSKPKVEFVGVATRPLWGPQDFD